MWAGTVMRMVEVKRLSPYYHRKPASGIEQVTGVVADVGELEPGNRAVVGGFERAFVFEGERSRCVFGQAGG